MGELLGVNAVGKQKVPGAGGGGWAGWVSLCDPSPSLESRKCLA